MKNLKQKCVLYLNPFQNDKKFVPSKHHKKIWINVQIHTHKKRNSKITKQQSWNKLLLGFCKDQKAVSPPPPPPPLWAPHSRLIRIESRWRSLSPARVQFRSGESDSRCKTLRSDLVGPSSRVPIGNTLKSRGLVVQFSLGVKAPLDVRMDPNHMKKVRLSLGK